MNQRSGAGLETCQDFATAFAERVQRIGHGVPMKTAAEQQLCWDFARGERRYRFCMLQRVLMLAAKCTDPADAEALEELMRSYRLAARPEPTPSLDAVFAAETEAQAHADIAQWRFMRSRCGESRAIVTRALTRQLVFTRSALDAVYHFPTAA
jgi:endonuclease III